jgi:hypothetical protein
MADSHMSQAVYSDRGTRYFHGNGYNLGGASVYIDGEQAATGEVIARAMRIAGDHGKLDADQAEEFGRRVREIATEFRSYEEGAR